MATSPRTPAVYRLTIAPLDQPAAVRKDASDTPFLRAVAAQPLLHAWADGASMRFSSRRMALLDMFNRGAELRDRISFLTAEQAEDDKGAILGLPVFDVRTTT